MAHTARTNLHDCVRAFLAEHTLGRLDRAAKKTIKVTIEFKVILSAPPARAVIRAVQDNIYRVPEAGGTLARVECCAVTLRATPRAELHGRCPAQC